MKTVCKENLCYACGACVELCPTDAIKLEKTLFTYNAVISDKCIDCHLCLRVCQRVDLPVLTAPNEWFQGWANGSQRNKSTSGGAATEICRSFIRNGGVVCSCVLSKGEFSFSIYSDTEEVGKSTGSKYVKSNVQSILNQIKALLIDGKRLLFVGLPCQVGAVKRYVGDKLVENLYTIDIVCHGTPSLALFKMFLQQHKYNINCCNEITFRDGNNYHITIDGVNLTSSNVLDYYTMAFVNGISFTENCYECEYARFDRVSDLTLGDAWGTELSVDEVRMGISLLLCQNEKGRELINNANLHIEPVNIELIKKKNQQLNNAVEKPSGRTAFVDDICKGKSIDTVTMRAFPWLSIKQEIKKIIM